MICFVEEIRAKSRATLCCWCATWVLFAGTVFGANALQAHGTQPNGSHARTTTGSVRTKATGSKQRTTSRAAQPSSPPPTSNPNPTPATVLLNNGLLTVDANNSDLGQILKDIADVSGMSIDGSISSVRVFGVYGPSNSREVLTDLLTGLGYNFMMVGATQEGTPRQLQLSLRNASATPTPSSPAVADTHENPAVTAPDPDAPGPGAVVNVPPPPPDDQQQRVQQNLQRLQQMHEPPKPPQ